MNISPEHADWIVRLTAWIVVICYLARCSLELRGTRDRSVQLYATSARWLWTVGCLVFLAHVLIALALVHGMSHAAAYAHTAERTAAVVGVRWGGGIYINHAFALFWIVDVIGWWTRGSAWAYGSRQWYWTVQGIFAFMFLNATVVFGPGYWVPIAVVVFVLFVVLALTCKRHQTVGKKTD